MAVVLDALAPYVKKMIADMAEEEISMLLCVEAEIQKLNNNVVNLQAYLTDAERRRITDKNVKAWVGKLKDVLYEATDILELCQLEAMERPEKQSSEVGGASSSRRPTSFGGHLKKKLQGCFQPLVFCLRNPMFAHETGSRIKKLNEDLDNIRKDVTKLNFINLGSYEDQRKLTVPATKKMTSGFNVSEVVGEKIEKDAEQLVQKLIAQDGRDLKVVAIVGQGGMGKSLLAKKIFATEVIKDEFKTKIWLCVTQHFDKVDLLRSAITHAGGKHDEEKDESILEQTLTEALSVNKFLLVLDDVWSVRAWKDMLQVPAANASRVQPGSRVLVTSRMEDVVREMGASSCDQLRVTKLDDEDAWSLLKKQLLEPEVTSGTYFDHLKDIGMKIIIKCDGLPLAIKVMGGLLSTRRPSILEWENILKKIIEWKNYGLHEELNSSVHLSYDDLSPELKQCFLYYSLFPKGSARSLTAIISMWISEGFIQGDGRSESNQPDVEEIGTEYHRELVTRNLLELEDGSLYDYSMHDVVRSFAEFVAREEALVVQKEQTDIRNLLLTTQKLRHLRYLRLKGADISRLPADIHKMKFLEHIALINCMRLNKLPDSITKLECLRFLALDGSNIDVVPMGFGAIKKLTTVFSFPAKMYGDWCSLEELGPLCDLKELSIQYLENVPDSSTAARAMISNKKSLVYLDLNCYRDDEVGEMEKEEKTTDEQQRIEAVFNGLCPPPSLEDLFLSKYFGHRPPIWLQAPAAVAFRSLRFISLWHLSNCNQLPNGLCGMLNLEYIQIIHAPSIEVVGPDFQSLASGDGGAVVTRPFPKLRKLVLEDLPQWKEWDWEEEQGKAMAMPALEELCIQDCKLSRLPQGLASHNRCNLRTLFLYRLSILASVENFPSVVEFDVLYCPELKKISGFSKLRKISIRGCAKLKMLEGFPVLCSMVLDDEPWVITGTPVVCTPKVCQVGQQPQLPENFTVTR